MYARSHFWQLHTIRSDISLVACCTNRYVMSISYLNTYDTQRLTWQSLARATQYTRTHTINTFLTSRQMLTPIHAYAPFVFRKYEMFICFVFARNCFSIASQNDLNQNSGTWILFCRRFFSLVFKKIYERNVIFYRNFVTIFFVYFSCFWHSFILINVYGFVALHTIIPHILFFFFLCCFFLLFSQIQQLYWHFETEVTQMPVYLLLLFILSKYSN